MADNHLKQKRRCTAAPPKKGRFEDWVEATDSLGDAIRKAPPVLRHLLAEQDPEHRTPRVLFHILRGTVSVTAILHEAVARSMTKRPT